ncbi:nucleoside deaminase [Methylobacterium sp. NEAU 140]|uniref:nucleoside deaminase n=1 Tax=Methylobacterium sp. NEAU 140 TaxID=3064945 RepID=UPI002732D603|nr:nucleoside deaminase [Methylobacterium sp. NEAU 140]MDP4021521.1 nucleoside deaminase [Methylobacterium sp. NEAU 140]
MSTDAGSGSKNPGAVQGDASPRSAAMPSSSRRQFLGGIAAGVAVSTESQAAAVPATATDEAFMREAIALARSADFPFGAVIVADGEVRARGRNLGKQQRDPTAHGEMVAIRRFLAQYGPEALRGTTLYTSGEPCVMCMGAIVWCGIARVVYAASIADMARRIGQIMITCTEVADKTPFLKVDVTGGVLSEEALALFPEK